MQRNTSSETLPGFASVYMFFFCMMKLQNSAGTKTELVQPASRQCVCVQKQFSTLPCEKKHVLCALGCLFPPVCTSSLSLSCIPRSQCWQNQFICFFINIFCGNFSIFLSYLFQKVTISQNSIYTPEISFK